MMRQTFLSLLGSVVGVGALGACSDFRKPFDDNFCSDGSLSFLTHISPESPADYVALRSGYAGSDPTVIEEVGECMEAPGTCDSLLQAPIEERGFRSTFSPETEHVAVLRGDDLELLFTADEVAAFLGTIDTEKEAALLAYAQGYDLGCGGNNLKVEEGGFLLYGEKGQTCGDDITGYQIFVSQEGEVTERDSKVVVRGDKNCVIGRLPDGLCDVASNETSAWPSDLGTYFSEMAYLEAAAVAAFENLAEDLAALGAPRDLVNEARKAAREEVRHVVLTSALARHFGAERQVPHVHKQPRRSALQLALENAVEGLTRESYGALVGLHQAATARHPLVRRVMELVAHDEAGHAELSWKIGHWLSTQLDEPQRAQVERTRRGAIARFRRAATEPVADELRRQVGLPSAATATQLFDALFAELEARASS